MSVLFLSFSHVFQKIFSFCFFDFQNEIYKHQNVDSFFFVQNLKVVLCIYPGFNLKNKS